MHGDFSRWTHDPKKHYSAVLKQQGRVELDSDANEQVAIQQHLRHSLAKDVIGPTGAPIDGGGFEITASTEGNQANLKIGAGHIYVDGILCELGDSTDYDNQLDYPDPSELSLAERTDLVYLDVWQRHVTAVEDPNLRDVALGGPDTTTRLQTVWQVKIKQGIAALAEESLPIDIIAPGNGRLTNRVDSTAGYQGLENRLYRVEIHQPGDMGDATFKWSRDNGAVVYGVASFETLPGSTDTLRISVEQWGRDQVLALRTNDWVELLDDWTELRNEAGLLARIKDVIDTQRQVICEIAADENVSRFDIGRHLKLRRWDGAVEAGIAASAKEIELEDGIHISFSGDNFKTADFWIFAARSATRQIESLAESPAHGVQHHYCILAFVQWRNEQSVWRTQVQDCRPTFAMLTDQWNLLRVNGDGQLGRPNDQLPLPLQVRCVNGGRPMAGVQVKFEVEIGGGSVISQIDEQQGRKIHLETNADGEAWCDWLLGDFSHQTVKATAEGSENLPIYFNARADVQYDNADRSVLAFSDTVQEALDTLDGNHALFYVGGDGQQGVAGLPLEAPLIVRCSNGRVPARNVPVTFEIARGNTGAAELRDVSNAANQGTKIDVLTDEAGMAACTWTLGPSPSWQRVEAYAANLNPLQRIWFNAQTKDTSGYVMPVGCVVPYAGETAPEGWLLCDGAEYATGDYRDLFGVIGQTYGGSGDRFNVPNLLGRGPMGHLADDPHFGALGKVGGTVAHALTVDELAPHDHEYENNWFEEADRTGWEDRSADIECGRARHATQATKIRGSGHAHPNLAPYLTLSFIIKC